MEEALAALVFQGFLMAFGGVLGMLVGRRVRKAPTGAVVGGAVLVAVLLSVLAGVLTGQAAATAAGALGWAVVFVLTVLACSALPRVPAALVAVAGGFASLHAMMIGFVLVAFTAVQAPREHAFRWLPAVMTGLVDDLGEPADETVAPLWVRITNEVGALPAVVLIAAGFVAAFLYRRGAAERLPADPSELRDRDSARWGQESAA